MLPTEQEVSLEKNISVKEELSLKTALFKELFNGEFPWQLPDKTSSSLTSLFSSLEKYAFDGGLAKKREFVSPSGELLTSEPVAMYNRSSFLDIASRKLEKDSKYRGSFFLIDIANLRDADLAKDAKNNKAADLLLNQIADKIQTKIAEFKNNNIHIEVSRYGGDEFMFLLDESDKTKREEYMKKIEEAIKEVKGFYVERDKNNPDVMKHIEKKVSLKMLRPFNIPNTGTSERKIFDYYMKKGLILSDEDMLKIKLFNYEGIDALERSKIKKVYPADLFKDTDSEDEKRNLKISYLIKQHPELKISFSVIEGNKASQDQVLTYVENIMYDRLLNEVILGFTDMEDHILKGDFKKILLFDMKFIKEINDKVSLIEGDKAILELWQQIRLLLKDIPQVISDEKRDVQVYRRGGTFAIGFTKNVPDEIIRKVSELNDKMIQWNGTAVPIGSAQWDLTDTTIEELKKDNTIRKGFDPILQDMSKNWLDKIAYYESENLPESTSADPHKFTLPDLIRMYFEGEKRGIERNQGALRYYEEKRSHMENGPAKYAIDVLISKHTTLLHKLMTH